MTLRDIENIENNLNIPNKNYTTFKSKIPSQSLCVINRTIYYEIRSQIIRADYDGCIDQFDIIQHIRNNWQSEQHKDIFLEYAQKYSLLCYHSSIYDTWMVATLCEILLELNPFDADLNSRRAIALSTLGDADEGEKYHKKATKGRYINAFANYGYFLFKHHRYEESVDVFDKALRINPLNIKSMLGKGRALSRLDNIDGAVFYYRKAAAIDPRLDMPHIRLGGLYKDMQQFEEAKREYMIANELWPYSHQTNYVLAIILEELGEMDGVKYYLKRCLDLNPTFQHAKERYYKCFDCYYSPSANAKEYMLNGKKPKPRPRQPPRCSEKEFEIFWFDKLEMWMYDQGSSQFYFECFQKNGLKNMDALFSMSMNKLKEIGIESDEHIEIIMDAIDRIVIDEHNEFKDWINSIVHNQQILKEYIDLFLHYDLPIYSIESFYRNVSSVGKLRNIIGSKQSHIVSNIWQSFCDNFM